MKTIRKVGIAGRGAIGALYGTLLLESGCEDLIFIVDEARKKRYEENPLTVNDGIPPFRYEVTGEPLDLVMICTKESGLLPAIEQIRPFVDEDTIVLSCLNGISSEEICRKVYGENAVIRTIVQGMDSTYLNNHVDFVHVGEVLFGAENKIQEETVQTLAAFFETHHIPYRVCEDIVREQWNKLMLNCGVNQVCAAYRIGYGGCQKNGPYYSIFRQAMEEVRATAVSQGVNLTEEDIDAWCDLVDLLRPDGMPSMYQDILAGRKTELNLFSGTVIPLARQHGIETPVLDDLKDRILKIESAF